MPVEEAQRRGSKSSEEDRTDPRWNGRHGRHESDRERSREKDRDSGSSGSRRQRPRTREGEVDGGKKERPVLRARKYSSHDDLMRRYRDREYDRERDREGERERERAFEGRGFRDRERARRGVSPVRGVDGRKYPSTR